MTNNDQVLEILDACDKRRDARRAFLRGAGSVAAVVGASGLAGCGGGGGNDTGSGVIVTPPPTATPAPTPTNPPTSSLIDLDILNFALNLEYLEAQFYSFAAFGTGLPANLLTGLGTQGAVTGGKQVNFTDPLVAQYAREIAIDERNHVVFLRQALGGAAVAQPAINIASDANSSFSAAARAAGIIGAGQSFDAYANDENFLLGAFIFEDVGVTAYKGASPLISNKMFLEAAAGILAAEAYHSGLIRTVLYAKGLQTPVLRTNATRISDARDSLDNPQDVDQGIEKIGNMSNIVPSDSDGLAYSRTAGDVLNIVYLTAGAAQQGGFFPAGVNGTIRASTAG
jgi:hypothetical protein